jgi:hypothetical protein
MTRSTRAAACGAADWKLQDRTQVRLEVPVDGYNAEPWNGVTDYCLYDASGNVLAVLQANKCTRNAREADEQLRSGRVHAHRALPACPVNCHYRKRPLREGDT